MRFLKGSIFLAVAFFAPYIASAHEVYVLDNATIMRDIVSVSPNPFSIVPSHQYEFIFWGFIAFVVISTVFFMSITHRLEELFHPFLQRIKPWAPLVARVTLGSCLIFCAYNGALFGPELPLHTLVPPQYISIFELALYATGILIFLGFLTRLAAAVVILLFAIGTYSYTLYMLTYANYFGEMLVVLLLGGGKWSLDSLFELNNPLRAKRFEPYAFLALRVLFGISVAFASFFAKFLHSDLALDTISRYHLTNFFHFEPLFIVLGACIIEILMGIFFALGFEVRHTSLFFLFWITLSLFYFGESVWPHLILVGVNLAIFMYGYDRLTMEGRLFSRGKYEPFL